MTDPQLAALRSRHPGLREAILADARMFTALRFERHELRSGVDALRQVLRLLWVSDAFAGLVLYRVKARLQRAGVPVLPGIAHRLAMIVAQVSIGDPVLIAPGVYVPHGQVVIDGWVEIGSGSIISPFVSIGLTGGNPQGPKIGPSVTIGTGAALLGEFNVGAGAVIGANAVVLDDVPEGATVVGMPAKPVDASE